MKVKNDDQDIICYHCFQKIDFNIPAIINQKSVPCCCIGCKTIVETVDKLNLNSFYELRGRKEQLGFDESAFSKQSNEGDNTFQVYNAKNKFEYFNDPLFIQSKKTNFVLPEETQNKNETVLSANLYLKDMHCAACVWLIEKSSLTLNENIKTSINLMEKTVKFEWKEGSLQLSDIAKHLASIGYLSKPISKNARGAFIEKEAKNQLMTLAFSGFISMQVMMLSVGMYIGEFKDITAEYQHLMLWTCLFLTTPVLFFSGRHFFTSAAAALGQKTLNMDVPISIALILAFAVSVINTIKNLHPVYFDTICMLVFFIGISRYIEFLIARKSFNVFEKIRETIPSKCSIVEGDNEFKIDTLAIKTGDIIIVRAGEFIPVDGEVIEGTSSVNESTLNGEFASQKKSMGDWVYAGTTNADGVLKIKAKQSLQNSQLSRLESLAQEAQANKDQYVNLSFKVTQIFVISLLILCAVNISFWYVTNPEKIIETTLAMLIVSCPCALALAIPLATSAAKNNLLLLELLAMKSDIFENMKGITDVVFDKTGTLTQGRYQLKSIHINSAMAYTEKLSYEMKLKSIAASLEAYSNHPLASAFKQIKIVHSTNQIPALIANQGIEAEIEGMMYRIGTLEFVSELAENKQIKINPEHFTENDKPVYLGNRHEILAIFWVSDNLKNDAKYLSEKMQSAGLRVHILSGDEQKQVERVAKELNIKNFVANCLPLEKLNYVKNLQSKGLKIMTVGDGLNDAPFLAAGDVRIAMGFGSGLTQEQADMVLLGNKLLPIYETFLVKKVLNTRISQNLMWALLYNVIVIPLAAAGYIPPYVAAIGMSLSSLIVVVNSARTFKYQKEDGTLLGNDNQQHNLLDRLNGIKS